MSSCLANMHKSESWKVTRGVPESEILTVRYRKVGKEIDYRKKESRIYRNWQFHLLLDHMIFYSGRTKGCVYHSAQTVLFDLRKFIKLN